MLALTSTKTDRLREDLGVSLSEAASLKLSAIRKNAATPSKEWQHYAADAKKMLDHYLTTALGKAFILLWHDFKQFSRARPADFYSF